MIDYENIAKALAEFFLQPDKDWSLASFQFFVAFILFYIIYIGICNARKNVRLSYVILFGLFFAWKANGMLMLLLPATAVFSWWATRKMMRLRQHRKLWLTAIILIELAPLIYFKYTNFLVGIFNDILKSNFGPFEMILPVGISFYTFQAISYSVDVYKWKFTSETRLPDYLFYLTFFPLIMAGPITRAEVLIPQLRSMEPPAGSSRPSIDALTNKGLWLIIIGIIKKVVIADYIAQFNSWVFADPMAYSGVENLMAVFGFTLQIFCDFSGYSDIAIGLAALMGIELRENFNFPYQSLNPTDFWHRWHIALSTWFRDYMYIPLGGNRHGMFRTCLNCFLTMIVAGLWHGASWMFVIWGTIHGGALVVHKVLKRLFLDKIPNSFAVRVISWCLMFAFICFSWIFFRAENVETALTIIKKIGTDCDISNLLPFITARPLWVLLVALGLELHSIRREDYEWLQLKFIESPWYFKLIIFVLTLQLAINFSQYSVQPFIYSRF